MKKEFFIERYKKLGWEFSEFDIKKAIRVNTLKITRDKLQKRLEALGIETSKIDFAADGLLIEKAKFSPGSSVEYLLGYYYMQGAASQIPAQLLGPKETDMVLDCCAAPGGKATHLSQLMKNKGIVIALDKKSQRLIALKNNLERMGSSNVVVYNIDALNVSSLNMKFDRILLDAPCSGNFTQGPGWFEKRDMDGIRGNAENQKKLFEACFNVLKPGGSIVYSTCSLEPEENEENAKWFEKTFNVKLIMQKRYWPSKKNQGFFIAKFERKK